MTGEPDFERLDRCFACEGEWLDQVGPFLYLQEQGGFVPEQWMNWCRQPAVLLRCPACGSQGPRRRPSAALLSAWYTGQSYAASDLISEGHRRAAERLRGMGVKSLVDVGCGAGTFLDLLGGEVESYGLEPSVASAEFGRTRGRRIVAPAPDGWSPELPPRVDVITLFDVLEHLTSPRDFLAGLTKRLKPGGRLVIFTGDAGSSWARRWDVRWWYHGWAGHLSCFSAAGLQALLGDLKARPESLDALVYMYDQRPTRAALRSLPFRMVNRVGALRAIDVVRTPFASSPLGRDHMLMIARLPGGTGAPLRA